ncbi:hypothetical protein crov399 [Cafeteria roenbergensis virus]|uniref:Uncharacterized protein n=1 Tax=Cafeteria roenbergensis virus (strain BV-PW1) TaxID=693272 RepID=E3T5H0_CROVB|nr:hypothetical protein crov399 [Cafeteria roenbergensis virus BV-PW1]ADO67433.1 hypothetical protein crov399 [Cafeteria roenbergensis virus BV-PW1]
MYFDYKKQLGRGVYIQKNKDINWKEEKIDVLDFNDRLGCKSLEFNKKYWNSLSTEIKCDINIICLSYDVCPTFARKIDKETFFRSGIYTIKEGINLLLSCNSAEVAKNLNRINDVKKPMIGFKDNIYIINNIIITPNIEDPYKIFSEKINEDLLQTHHTELLYVLLTNGFIYLSAETLHTRFTLLKNNIDNNKKSSEREASFKKEDFTKFTGSLDDLKALPNYDETGIIKIIDDYNEYIKKIERERLEFEESKRIASEKTQNIIDELTYEVANSIFLEVFSEYQLKEDTFLDFKEKILKIVARHLEEDLTNLGDIISDNLCIKSEEEEDDEEDDDYEELFEESRCTLIDGSDREQFDNINIIDYVEKI